MLHKLIHLNNVGVFKQGLPEAIDLERANLVYAENGRGKSTLSAVLHSLSSGDVEPLKARLTFGASGNQQVLFRAADGAKPFNLVYDGKAWSALLSKILVFDQDFVERNVYAGSEVKPDHHEALLEFALGASAVLKKQEVDAAGASQAAATKRRTAAEEQLVGYRGKVSLSDFLKLSEDASIDSSIEAVERRIADAKDSASIAARVALGSATSVTFNFDRLRAVLAVSLDDIHAEAEKEVREHLDHLASALSEKWLATGLTLLKDDGCPFCNQSTVGTKLVSAYRSYFNAAYETLAADVQNLPTTASQAFAVADIQRFESIDAANRERINTWAPQLKLELECPDIAAARAGVQVARSSIQQLVEKKQKAPLRAVDYSAELGRAEQCLVEAGSMLEAYNKQIDGINELITGFKAKLASEKASTLEVDLQLLRTQKTRYEPAVLELVAQRAQAGKHRDEFETAKATARKELDALMDKTLGKFQNNINRWLSRFGASFTVEKLKASYLGSAGAPRTEYGISVRGVSVPAGKKSAGPSFQTALSDGDKRTLALAFFMAKLFDDQDRATRIVVVDDMFTSLDKHRRSQTVNAIVQITKTVAQVFVFAHDAYFLRDVAKALSGKGVCKPLVLGACRGPDDFSELRAGFDIDEECATPFYKRYRSLQDFLAGQPSESPLSVAQGLRSLLEGHLHRRFPGHIKDGITVGQVLETIKAAKPGSPLFCIQPCLPGLHELNDFASAFHHDTDGTAARSDVTDTEVVTFGARTMNLLHSGVV